MVIPNNSLDREVSLSEQQHLVAHAYKCLTVQTNPATDGGNTQPASFPPITTTLDGSLYTCDAVSQCAALALSRSNQYYSFDLHFDRSVTSWICVQYYDPGQTAADFTVVNPNVGEAYGYTAYT